MEGQKEFASKAVADDRCQRTKSQRDNLAKAEQIFLIIRVLVAMLIAVHGFARLFADAVTPFGTWLQGQNIPFGMLVAYLITFAEIFGTALLAFGRFVPQICSFYIFVYLVGIVMVHAPEGWFVVGLGRNGMEYSVLLIGCLGCLAYWHLEIRKDESES